MTQHQLLPGDVPIFIGAKIKEVQDTLAPVYGYTPQDFVDCFDGFLEDGGNFQLGELMGQTCGLPGHTPDSIGILLGDCLFAGDSLFM